MSVSRLVAGVEICWFLGMSWRLMMGWLGPNVINLSCSPAQGKPPEAASRHGRRAMTRPLPLNQAV
jgi:hypothetical protein